MRRSIGILVLVLLARPAALHAQAPAAAPATPDSLAGADSASGAREERGNDGLRQGGREGRGHEGMRRGEREGPRGARRGNLEGQGHRGEGAGRPGRPRRPRAPEGHRPAGGGGDRPRP